MVDWDDFNDALEALEARQRETMDEAREAWREYFDNDGPPPVTIGEAATLYEKPARERALENEQLLRWEADFRQPSYYDWFLTEVTR